MRKFITASLALCLLFSLLCIASCSNKSDYKSRINSEVGFIYYFDNDTAEYIGNENERVYPASITKLLTSLTALNYMSPDELITPGDEVYLVQSGSSSAYIRPNHTLTLEMLIEGMIIPSGNDAAYATAAACGYTLINNDSASYTDAVDCFVSYMNQYAEALGCTNTHFTTPDGFAGSEHYSSLHDMLLISKTACENSIISKYAAMKEDNVIYASGHTNTWTNTNKLLDSTSDFYHDGVIGLKTGSLDDNYSIIVLYENNDKRYLIGLFGAKNDSERYKDALTIIDYLSTLSTDNQ